MVKEVKTDASHTEASGLISEAEMMERQKAYLTRLHDVSAACQIFKKALAQFRDLQEDQTFQDRWNQYLRCDGLPKVRSPVEIRTFLAKIHHFEQIENDNSINWTLGVDERSILSQNIFQQDLTRKTLEKSSTDNPGSCFEKNIKDCLEVLRLVDILMDNEVEMERLEKKVQIDLMEVYEEVQREIESLYDRLTYRLLRLQNVYMRSYDGIVGRWSYSCDPWRMDLWGLYNVPIIFKQLEVPVMLADFEATGVEVQLPMSALWDCVTLRCVHTSFDHRSEHAKSYEVQVVDSSFIPNSGITDMEESVVGEWLMQHDIQEEVLDKMNQRRFDYEETMRIIAERTEQAAKEAKFNKSGEKSAKIIIPKTPKVVPFVPPGMYPEISKEFLAREDDQYHRFLDTFYNPSLLNLSAEEINLRECIIIGGTYNISFVRRPDQTQYQKFNIILHEDGRVLYVVPDVVADADDIQVSRVTEFTRMTLGATQMKLEENELPFFVVTVKLSPDLCRWGQPEVCQYLKEVESPPHTPERNTLVTLNLVDNHRITSQLIQRDDLNSRSMSTNLFQPNLKSIIKQSVILALEKREKGKSIKDFSLNKPLNKIEMLKLEKVCIPRIISSFKLPSEFTEDFLTAESLKARPNRLVKRPETELTVDVELKPENLSYESQERPERMFPVFEHVVPVDFIPADDTLTFNSADLTTAYGLYTTLENIKRKYVKRPLQLVGQTEPVTKKDKSEKVDTKVIETRASTRASNVIDKNLSNAELVSLKSTSDVKLTNFGSNVKLKKISIVNKTTENAPPRRSGSVMRRRSSRKSAKLEELKLAPKKEKAPPVVLEHWTKEHIIESKIDTETSTLTFRTDRLGIFGLAFKRYEHFPFHDWSLQPNDENPDEVIFSLDTFHVRMVFYITAQGVRGYVTDLSTGYVAKPVKYLEIEEPISDFREFRKLLVARNLNIFAENDAQYYITNGYFSIKHAATEMHAYNTMALQCKLMKFYRSSWNRLALRRDVILDMKIAKDNTDYSEVTMRITPEKTTFVKISELCSDDINVVKLRYEETWRNVNNYNDFGQAIYSLNPHTLEGANKDAMLFVSIKRLLNCIRPLSYS
ncbi:uncharacterized protein LOC108114649 [Drosophila eugracilis]|uniref:uncharacterized protein LOC108114649 n=1 Tax=Drosophila eugracilis TaxID=29029 RepID=UPI001BDA7D98|nr:uncharacterized protein LOC108114649 [Drosophila eugracilis]